MTLSGLLIFASIYAVAVASPGPGVALIVARSLAKGLDGLQWFIAGFVVGDLVLCALAYSGLAVVARTFETAFLVIRYAGCAYLFWLAWKIWHAPVSPVAQEAADAKRESPWQVFLSSFSLTMGNPKAIVFFMSVMPLAVDLGSANILGFAEVALVMIPIFSIVIAGYALLADRARRLFRSSAAVQRINRGTAVMMGATAALIAAKS